MKIGALPETAKERDERLLEEWKREPMGWTKDQKLSELLKSLAGPINSAINTYRGAPLPGPVLELEGKRIAVQAAKEWDRYKGTSLASYVGTMVRQRLYRYVSTHQNIARIPEEQVRRIGKFQDALGELSGRYGREPTTDEIADHMGVPVAHVARLRKSLRQDLLESGTDSFDDHQHDPDFERAQLAYYQLTQQEKQVFDYLLGAHGQPKLKPSEIARRLGVAAPRISAIKKAIANKLGPYLQP